MTKTPNRWIGLVFVAMSISLVIIDGTIVNTIFPKVIDALSLTSSQVQWVQEVYVLVFAALLLIWGAIADEYGRKRMLIIGIVIFTAASVWAGFSTSADSLILARVAQGFGGAMVLPTTLSLVNANFQGKERGIAFAIWGSTIGGMVAVGPVLGGWLATDFGTDGWRLAFNINAPLGVIIIIGLLYFTRESKSENHIKGLDVVGAILSAIMFATLVFGLIEGRIYGWWAPNADRPFTIGDFTWTNTDISVIPISLAISLVTGFLFVQWERHRSRIGKSVILDLALFHIASFRNGSIAAGVISLGEFGILFAIPLWLQNVEGLTPISSGLVLLWLAGGAFMASGIGGALSGKLPPARAIQIGVGLEMLGVAGIAIFASTNSGWLALAPFLLLYGLGIGLATAQLTGVIMVDVPVSQTGQASGSQSTVRQIGSALGIAVLGTVLFTSTQVSLESKLTELNVPAAQVTQISNAVVDSAGAAIPLLGPVLEKQGVPAAAADQIVSASGEAFTDGAKTASVVAGAFLLLGFGSTFNLGRRREKQSAK